jgi:hypothetical protein
MPTISPSLIPTKSPGNLFASLTGGDSSLNVRWLTAVEPVFFEVLNRPMADITVRQLVIAKAIDSLTIRLGHQATFPFLTTAKVTSGTSEVEIIPGWIWDVQASIPKKWENLRLSKIQRISGSNGGTGTYDGRLRLIFSANISNQANETSLLYADYNIDSYLTYQTTKLQPVTTAIVNNALPTSESNTVCGQIIFKTLDTTLGNVQAFLDLLAPGGLTDSNSDGFYDTPATYEISDSVSGGVNVTEDFSPITMSHGTGLLTSSAYNTIPELDSDINSWLTSFNFPFDAEANLTSADGIVIPKALFREFDITAPAGDNPTGDTSGTFYPVWVNRIERIGTTSDHLRFYFATYNVTDTITGGTPSTAINEFATMDLYSNYGPGEVVEITPIFNLQLQTGTDSADWNQHFGRGHAVLSSLWNNDTTTVSDFFTSFDFITDSPADTLFVLGATRLSNFGVSRVPKYTPTIGQGHALLGSTSRRAAPLAPNAGNRFVTELDQGPGDTVDLESYSGITANAAIERYGNRGSICHKIIRLVINADQLDNSDANFYENKVLPRLRILLGRDPQFGDFWFNGTRLMFHNGDSWSG